MGTTPIDYGRTIQYSHNSGQEAVPESGVIFFHAFASAAQRRREKREWLGSIIINICYFHNRTHMILAGDHMWRPGWQISPASCLEVAGNSCRCSSTKAWRKVCSLWGNGRKCAHLAFRSWASRWLFAAFSKRFWTLWARTADLELVSDPPHGIWADWGHGSTTEDWPRSRCPATTIGLGYKTVNNQVSSMLMCGA